ncbi:MAG: type II toxin-antitoxin system HicB family antitoxin [Coriobacteriales bacterium]|jgi:predicted transcriptional regulator|nr:type II toxin-antitoxin system HicB family antitoxin [Coriobacteriales bacterium]
MSSISIRIPDSLHRGLRDFAARDHVSMNQFIASAIAEKMSALAAQDYLEARAARGSRTRFEQALALVPDAEPDEADKLV